MISGLFGKKPAGESGDAGGPAGPVFQPDKAEKFFAHARVAQEAEKYEYAMGLWLRGLQLDPRMLPGVEGYVQSASHFLQSPEGKKRVSKETRNVVSGSGDVNKFLAALYEWSMSVDDKSGAASWAIKAAEAVAKIGAGDVSKWVAEAAYAAVRKDPKQRKDSFVRLMKAADIMGFPDIAVNSGEDARRIDPSDGQLANEVKMLAAKATMAKGGYERTGQEGGFRANIRDASKQQALEESTRISKTEDVKDREVVRTEAEFNLRPEDLPTLGKLVEALRSRGKPEDEERAHTLLLQAYERTKIYKLRQDAGEIRMRQTRRRVSEAKRMLDTAPDDPIAQSVYETERNGLLELEVQELKNNVENYPTDLRWRYELGKRFFDLGNFEEAIGQFQEAQNDPRVRGRVLHMLGQSFLRCDLAEESIETFRRAMEMTDMTPDDLRDVRYDLCCALQIVGENRRDLAAAEEAEKIASQILIQSIGYKDIKMRREALKKLVSELRAK
ncbi:MAG: hypothetical protein U0573_11970 [Phycisphaerales bacterium]|nr:hypothetical protein [Planctomycetota bacterium]